MSWIRNTDIFKGWSVGTENAASIRWRPRSVFPTCAHAPAVCCPLRSSYCPTPRYRQRCGSGTLNWVNPDPAWTFHIQIWPHPGTSLDGISYPGPEETCFRSTVDMSFLKTKQGRFRQFWVTYKWVYLTLFWLDIQFHRVFPSLYSTTYFGTFLLLTFKAGSGTIREADSLDPQRLITGGETAPWWPLRSLAHPPGARGQRRARLKRGWRARASTSGKARLKGGGD